MSVELDLPSEDPLDKELLQHTPLFEKLRFFSAISSDHRAKLSYYLIKQNISNYNSSVLIIPTGSVSSVADKLYNHDHHLVADWIQSEKLKIFSLNPLPKNRFYFKSDYQEILQQIEELMTISTSIIFYDVDLILESDIEQAEQRQIRDFMSAAKEAYIHMDLITQLLSATHFTKNNFIKKLLTD